MTASDRSSSRLLLLGGAACLAVAGCCIVSLSVGHAQEEGDEPATARSEAVEVLPGSRAKSLGVEGASLIDHSAGMSGVRVFFGSPKWGRALLVSPPSSQMTVYSIEGGTYLDPQHGKEGIPLEPFDAIAVNPGQQVLLWDGKLFMFVSTDPDYVPSAASVPPTPELLVDWRKEPESNLGAIATAMRAYHAENGKYLTVGWCPEVTSGPTPVSFDDPCSEQWTSWDSPTPPVGWAPDGDTRCRYKIDGGEQYVATAECDFDSDGVPAVFVVSAGKKPERITGPDVF